MIPVRNQSTGTLTLCRRSNRTWLLCSALLASLLLVWDAVAFAPSHLPSRSKASSRLSMMMISPTGANDEERRMAMVRSLQNVYYQATSVEPTVLEKDTGILRNLPLYRVQGTELPGRASVLNVHNGIYTNMFEAIIRGPKPWYFGHLHLPQGSKNLKSSEKRFQLKTWQQEVNDEARQTEKERSAVVGTLMQISDFRRLEDGSLLLLVQALERFVVADCTQTLPYSIANVQILPDLDEALVETEEEAQKRRAIEVVESFRFHDYECSSDFKLPLPEREYLSATNIWGPRIAEVSPFVPYSESSLDVSKIQPTVECVGSRESEDFVSLDVPSLESKLQSNGILKSLNFLSKKGKGESASDLEGRLWDALNDFCTASKLVLPREVLCLLPPGRSWGDSSTTIERVSSDYPSKRRQIRLSYAASAFLEQRTGADLRQAYLEAPGTKGRLSMVIESFEFINTMFFGRVLKK